MAKAFSTMNVELRLDFANLSVKCAHQKPNINHDRWFRHSIFIR